jgi:alkaline phosphatase
MRLNLVAAAMATLATLSGCAGAPPQAAQAADAQSARSAKHILFFLGAGLGLNTLTAARIYAVGEDGELTIDTLPESAFVKTFSNDAQVSDSAAAMSAYMTGVKVNNGVLSMTTGTRPVAPAPDVNALASRCANDRPAVTLAELAMQRGMGAGVVSNTRVTDATAGATYAHACRRPLHTDIAAALVPGGAGYNGALGTQGLDVVLGGGSDAFTGVAQGGKRSDGRDLLAELRAQGYRHVSTAAQLTSLAPRGGERLIGLFANGDMSFDAARDAAREPSLAEMTGAAIGVLSKNPKGFFLVVEAGLIGHALDASNAQRALRETVAFDNALKAAIAQMRAIDPGLGNTLIVVTADHDHTLLLNGYSRRTGKTTAAEPGVLGLAHKVGDGSPLLDLDGAPYTIIGFGSGENRVQGSRAQAPLLTDAIVSADDYRQEATIRLGHGSDTPGGTDVYLGAIGAGAQNFRGTIDNTRVFGLIKAAAGW